MLVVVSTFLIFNFSLPFVSYAAASSSLYNQGMEFYKAGRYSEAIDAFEQSVRRREKPQEAQSYIDRIRKETVERIRNRALTGINKSNWQSKFYFMNIVDGRVRVGISVQEMFERSSVNFRPGAIEALNQLANAISKAENTRLEVELINEIRLETVQDPLVTSQQLSAVFSYLSLASRGVLPKF